MIRLVWATGRAGGSRERVRVGGERAGPMLRAAWVLSTYSVVGSGCGPGCFDADL